MGCPRWGSSQSKGPRMGTGSPECLRFASAGVYASHAAGCGEVRTRTHTQGPGGLSLLSEDTCVASNPRQSSFACHAPRPAGGGFQVPIPLMGKFHVKPGTPLTGGTRAVQMQLLLLALAVTLFRFQLLMLSFLFSMLSDISFLLLCFTQNFSVVRRSKS